MKLYFKQNAFSFLGDANVYDEFGEIAYTVKGRLTWGQEFRIYDRYGNEAGMIKRKIMSFMPVFEIYLGSDYIGSIRKEVSFLHPHYTIDYNGWTVEGGTLEWNYILKDRDGFLVASAEKELMHLSDRYLLNINDEGNPDPLTVLMFIIAIDAEKASRSS